MLVAALGRWVGGREVASLLSVAEVASKRHGCQSRVEMECNVEPDVEAREWERVKGVD